jgi:hypothetical protein
MPWSKGSILGYGSLKLVASFTPEALTPPPMRFGVSAALHTIRLLEVDPGAAPL